MTRNSTIARVAVAVLSGSLGFALWTAPVYADAAKNGQPPVYGKTYGEWSAAWWQWALAGPKGNNAVQDTTGEFCDVDQPKGKVWFLAGSFGLPGVERTCTIPRNRALFYPLINSFWIDCPGTPDSDVTDAEVRDIMASLLDPACQLTSTLDGTPISSLQILTVRTQSPKFTTILPPNNIYSTAGICPSPLPPGKTGRMIGEGYWIMLPPLSPGEHVLTLHGASCGGVPFGVLFENGVTYHLKVSGHHSGDDD
jgi:hypothetical protein